MDSKMIARVGAVAFVAIALTMTALQMRDAPNPREDVFEVPLDESETDPVRQALIDCARRGARASDDPVCLRAWAENRRRFLTPGARPKEPLPQVDATEPWIDDAGHPYRPALDPQSPMNGTN
jgi:conjugative transfer region protein TrbK